MKASQSDVTAPTSAEQGSLDQYGEALEAAGRDSGMASALYSDSAWAAAALEIVRELAALGEEFTVERVVEILGRPGSKGVAGATMKRAQAAGWIELIAYRPSRRAGRHGSVVGIWRGRGASGSSRLLPPADIGGPA